MQLICFIKKKLENDLILIRSIRMLKENKLEAEYKLNSPITLSQYQTFKYIKLYSTPINNLHM